MSRRLASLVLIVMISATGCGRDPQGSPKESDLAQLPWAELGPFRPSVLRLSPGALQHFPCDSVIDSLIPNTALNPKEDVRVPSLVCLPADNPNLLELHLRVLRESAHWPQARKLHAQGLSFLLDPARDGALDRAERRLQEAIGLAPGSSATVNDLAVATLLRAAEEDRPDLLIEGLVLLDEALRTDPRATVALYNRALILSLLELRTPAQSAWRAYLDADPTSPWSNEAKRWLQSLDQPGYEHEWRSTIEPAIRKRFEKGDDEGLTILVDRHRQRTRAWAEEELMGDWAGEVLGGRSDEAGELLSLMGRVGAALGVTSGDQMLTEEVTRLRSASTHSLAESAAGHEALGTGFETLYSWRLDKAGRELAAAHRELENQHSPYALWARFYLALIDYYRKDYESSLQALEDLEKEIVDRPYPVLQGRVLWVQGLIHIARQRLKAALDCYQASLERFRAAGEEQNTAVLYALIAEGWSKLGDRQESWRFGFRALRGTPRIFMPTRYHALLESLILSVHREVGLEPFALALSQEHVPVAEATDGYEILHNAQMRLGATLQALGREEEALEAYRQAETAAALLDDPRFAARAQADRALLRAETMIDRDPTAAQRLLDQTIETYEATGFVYLLPQALDARARAHLALGSIASAERDLIRQIELHEATAADPLGDPLRMSYLGQAHAGFQRMVAFQAIERGRPVEALHYVERGRVRALLSLYTQARQIGLLPVGIQPQLAPVAAPRAICRRLPATTAILEYEVLDDRVLLWALRREGIELFELPGGEKDIAARAEAFHRSVVREEPELPGESAALYDRLIRPALEVLNGKERLIVVPDEPLAAVPFEALVDSRTGRFLVEDFEISYAPSATLYVQLLEERARRSDSGPVRRVLAVSGVGGHRFNPLPSAEQEALAVAEMYPEGVAVRGDGISPETLIRRIGEADVLHFAGHAVPNPSQELASGLILDDSPQALRELHVYDLYGHRFERTSLVVLSACATGRIHGHPGESVAILARPFLASGVPTVVGSLWEVDDRTTRALFTLFHRRLADGEDPIAALAETKRHLLQSTGSYPVSPRTWAAFVAIGAS